MFHILIRVDKLVNKSIQLLFATFQRVILYLNNHSNQLSGNRVMTLQDIVDQVLFTIVNKELLALHFYQRNTTSTISV